MAELPIMPAELQVANASNMVAFVVGIYFLYQALRHFGNPQSLKYFKVMVLGIFLYSALHEGIDIIAGTSLQFLVPGQLFDFWPVAILQSVGAIVFLLGAFFYHKEMFKSLAGD